MHPLLYVWLVAGWCLFSYSAALQDDSQAAILEKLDNIDRRLNRLDSLEGRLDRLDAGFDRLDRLESGLNRLDSLEGRIEQLNQQFTQLVNIASSGKLQWVFQDVHEVCEELRASQTTPEHTPVTLPSHPPPTTSTEAVVEQSHTSTPQRTSNILRVTRVTDEETETSYKLTAFYESTEKPQVFAKLSAGDGAPEEIQHDGSGVVTMQTNKSVSSLMMMFYLRYESHTIFFNLRGNRLQEFNMPNIHVSLEPGNEVSYTPGTDVDLKFHVTYTGDVESKLTQAFLFLKSASEDNSVDEFRLKLYERQAQNISDIQYWETHSSAGNNKTLLLHMPHSPHRDSGLVAFQAVVFARCPRSCLMAYFQAHDVFFYPSEPGAQFPGNYLGFVSNKEARRDTEVRKCSGNPCTVSCKVFGDNPSVNITKFVGSATSPHSLNIYKSSRYFANAVLEFKDPQAEDAGEYLCYAMSGDGSNVITKTIHLVVE